MVLLLYLWFLIVAQGTEPIRQRSLKNWRNIKQFLKKQFMKERKKKLSSKLKKAMHILAQLIESILKQNLI